jgi:hypothetical protein
LLLLWVPFGPFWAASAIGYDTAAGGNRVLLVYSSLAAAAAVHLTLPYTVFICNTLFALIWLLLLLLFDRGDVIYRAPHMRSASFPSYTFKRKSALLVSVLLVYTPTFLAELFYIAIYHAIK